MIDDLLSEVFDFVETQSLISDAFSARGPWVTRSATSDPLKLIAVVNGGARLTTDGIDRPLQMQAGDVAVLNNRSWLKIQGGNGDGIPREIPSPPGPIAVRLFEGGSDDTDVVLGSRLRLNPVGQELLLQVLPPVGYLRASAAAATQLRCSLTRLMEETNTNRIGSAFAVRRQTQLMLLDILRAYIEQIHLPAGWLRLLTDDRLRPVLSLMHTRPGERWTVDKLARAAAMSRTSFANHFRSVAGVPPLTYLNTWRMLLAQRSLSDSDAAVGPLGARLGYASESAFSAAFKRHTGESPSHYRRGQRRAWQFADSS
ncbi:AraC family transcriptional regulator [Micromonospora zingiberis]|uniref:AraC family transcriptional regulator n=1 Tax=Micromonospora zingiberis TaxID=2053011 RepID=A0A4R0FXG7_9ACTN|nr:AraC family transcriptional regulator [Micromonospora zingiberis]TCB88750.1 AraC family transcriptional regulator [Micromonospora zingiberis]